MAGIALSCLLLGCLLALIIFCLLLCLCRRRKAHARVDACVEAKPSDWDIADSHHLKAVDAHLKAFDPYPHIKAVDAHSDLVVKLGGHGAEWAPRVTAGDTQQREGPSWTPIFRKLPLLDASELGAAELGEWTVRVGSA